MESEVEVTLMYLLPDYADSRDRTKMMHELVMGLCDIHKGMPEDELSKIVEREASALVRTWNEDDKT